MAVTEEEILRRANKLAGEHWNWLVTWVQKGFLDAFVHGYKHGYKDRGEEEWQRIRRASKKVGR
jgi:hypothetical protein